MSADGIPTSAVVRAIVFTCGALFACGVTKPAAAVAACGDGAIDSPVEECDDGNTDAGDCCAADCRFEPASTPCGLDDLCLKAGAAACDGQGACALGDSIFCFGGPRAELWDPAEPEAEKLKVRVMGTEPIDNLGDPSAGTRYEICVYNYHGSGPLTVDYRLPLPVGEGWEPAPDGFAYRRPKGGATSVVRARVSTKPRTSEVSGVYYVSRVKLAARGSALALPGPIDSSRYFDAFAGISSVCVVNDLGFMIGIHTWGDAAVNRSFVNQPDHVRWVPPRLRD